jgi:DNA-binding MarR family transcriptional regulator
MKSFKKDLMDAVNLLADIESSLQINFLNPNEKAVLYSIVMKENMGQSCIISDVISISKLSRSTVFKTLKMLQSKGLISLIQSQADKREFNIQIEV